MTRVGLKAEASSGKCSTVPQRWTQYSLWIPTAEGELTRHLSLILFCPFIYLSLYLLHRVCCLQAANRTLGRLLPCQSLTSLLLHWKRNHLSFHFHPPTLKTSFYNLHNCLENVDSRVQWASWCHPYLQTPTLGNSFPRAPVRFLFKSFRPCQKELGCQISHQCSLHSTQMCFCSSKY